MTDVALLWDPKTFSADIAIQSGALLTDDGLRTAILISLFTDARARDDDVLPEPGADRRGWWGNAFGDADATPGDQIGSRLWLLRREKITASTIQRAHEYTVEALDWLIQAQVCSAIAVEVEAQGGDRLAIRIVADRPDGPARLHFDHVWEASA
jgi:phage gp46-like protein